jgi:hypothetical protein
MGADTSAQCDGGVVRGQGSSRFKIKLIVLISRSIFKVDISNAVHDFILFNFFKNVLTLTSNTPLDTSTLSHNYEINALNFI